MHWNKPRKSREDEIDAYDIRFRPKGGGTYSAVTTIDGSSKTITLTKTLGIDPQITYNFEVRARIGNTAGKWEAVSQYTGKYY